jgi:hypothetical protein
MYREPVLQPFGPSARLAAPKFAEPSEFRRPKPRIEEIPTEI